ncbi:MAG: outer membrane beta-barrel protein [Chitinophagaceae bacterium]|nr:outer membrane beta-barrel protein [Chitinophagaceae bacterium]
MKRLVVLSLMFVAFQANAQKVQLGLGAGASFNGQPTDNLVYKGDQSLLNYAVRTNFVYTTKTNIRFGIVGHMHELSSKSDSTYKGFPNRHLRIDSVGGDGKKLVYSKNTVAACLTLGYNFNLGTSTSIYIDGAIGWGFARNNSLYYQENEGYKAADGGDGMCYGGQLGIDQGLGKHVSFFIDAAFRYYTFDYDAGAPTIRPAEKLHYSIWAMPITIGLNFTLYELPPSIKNTYNVRGRKYN